MGNQAIQNLLNLVLEPYDAAAVVSQDNEVLLSKYENLADIGTLAQASATVLKYFQLKDGEAVLLNDPYSGGTLLSSVSLITPILDNGQKLYLVVRTQFRPQLTLSNNLEEEGLRIPPTPIAQNNELNTAILQAISAHPQCPENFASRLEQIWQRILSQKDKLKKLQKTHSAFASKLEFKNYLKACHERVKYLANEHTRGEARVEIQLDSGEQIKLKAHLTSDHLNLDFSGTSSSKMICMTDSATMGACVGALSAFLNIDLPMNSGSFSFFNVTTPLGSLLNAKYPSPTFRGMTQGVVMVATVVLRALCEVSSSQKLSHNTSWPTLLSIDFSDSNKFFDFIPTGISASNHAAGADAIAFWTRNRLRNSVEQIESRFPLQIKQISLRKNSGGKGQTQGGDGLVKEYEVLKAAKLSWMMEQGRSNLSGKKGGAAGLPGKIVVLRGQDEFSFQNPEGHFELQPMDRIVVFTAGGGGFGATANS